MVNALRAAAIVIAIHRLSAYADARCGDNPPSLSHIRLIVLAPCVR